MTAGKAYASVWDPVKEDDIGLQDVIVQMV